MNTATICSAADEIYFPQLRDMVTSALGGRPPETLSFSVLDLGLLPEQKQWLEDHNATLTTPGWDIPFPGQDEAPGWFRAMTGRPMLRDYFPGFSTYLWLDADIWVQDPHCLQHYLEAARRFGAAITPEVHPSYRSLMGQNEILTMHHNAYRTSFGQDLADALIRNPILNSGAFAMGATHPAWDKWAAVLTQGLARGVTKHVEQAALNATFYLPNTPSPHFLPAHYNWIVPLALPRIDLTTGTLHDCNMPFTSLGLIHLTGVSRPIELCSVKNEETTKVDIRYHAIRERFFSPE